MHCVQLADTIKSLCQERHTPISKMLNDCGISRNFIYDLEKRSQIPSCETVEKIADYFGISIDELLNRTLIYDEHNKKINTLSEESFKNVLKSPGTVQKILNSVAKLNTVGQTKALDYINDLSANPLYQSKKTESYEIAAYEVDEKEGTIGTEGTYSSPNTETT